MKTINYLNKRKRKNVKSKQVTTLLLLNELPLTWQSFDIQTGSFWIQKSKQIGN